MWGPWSSGRGDSLYLESWAFLQMYGWHLFGLLLVCLFFVQKFRDYQEWSSKNNRFLADSKKLELDRARERARQLQHERYLQTLKEKGGEAPSISELEKQKKKKKTTSTGNGSSLSSYRSNNFDNQPAGRRWGADRRRGRGGGG
uniref:Selenoprotein S n=1 Tax=Aplanochytrium stocchinoi TaxID=215587 RepID=A0A7S3PDW5_9STRA|mmetsp:Transcript_9654/g.12037  ORF Transcript_9654/g.12037 Transcript_9654/m.12037 type:complete len:144 (+) Transcript_9654:361-792(+)|eukprot:CAMPEP_0204831490 /NCGR_PEP_ID=MMETSP1346-20131115/10811_1 /ASSEMBLY_ACC=CAM_ASM_000771 /TAXON_ID=215587 /ORGANISM="Aplanochytrium stocchinoi, Strain GSBS06" /LENGTH=143 /DNA_ID=CAMNT_0051962577 /DNA_START=366 /DNA_END=797 /DNA_ORIENTATION=-